MKLGESIVFNRKLVRITYRNGEKEWDTIDIKERRGIFLGYRTLSNGYREYDSEEVGYVYYPREYIKAALVAFSVRMNPIYVPADCIRSVDPIGSIGSIDNANNRLEEIIENIDKQLPSNATVKIIISIDYSYDHWFIARYPGGLNIKYKTFQGAVSATARHIKKYPDRFADNPISITLRAIAHC